MSADGTALVTGGSTGIGLELARQLAANGNPLVIVSRDRERLGAVAGELHAEYGVPVSHFAKDLSQPRAAEELWDELSRADLTAETLVNNAGGGVYGKFQDQSVDELQRMKMVNMLALTTLTRLALPGMLARKRGRILNVASIVGYQPGGPRMAVYYATKAYVFSFSKALAVELEGTGVSVTTLSPGVTSSAFEDRSGASGTRLYRLMPQMSVRSVAAAAYRTMERGGGVVIPGLVAKILAVAGELPPRSIALAVNRCLLRRPHVDA
jgi:uncharacterized protein